MQILHAENNESTVTYVPIKVKKMAECMAMTDKNKANVT